MRIPWWSHRSRRSKQGRSLREQQAGGFVSFAFFLEGDRNVPERPRRTSHPDDLVIKIIFGKRLTRESIAYSFLIRKEDSGAGSDLGSRGLMAVI